MTNSFNPGVFLILGFEGPDPDRTFLALIEKFPPAGIIFLQSNYESPAQMARLVERLAGIVGKRTLFAVDQEPGRVQRFANAFPRSLPPGRYVENDMRDEFSDWCLETAAMLSDIGINLNLAPVVDLAPFGNAPSVLRERTFGDDVDTVSAYSEILIREHKKKNVLTCAKHFPGLGSSIDDPHVRLAMSRESKEIFENHHWQPFRRAAQSGVDAVMTTHLRAPSIDAAELATFSRGMVDIIRGVIGFDGAILSDDLLMTGAAEPGGVDGAAVKALHAGHNLVIISRDVSLQRRVLERVGEVYRDDSGFREILIDSEQRIERIKTKLPSR